ncbi:MAG: hydrogenase iron-sulfur subunit [Clostridiales bacterium]|nr:hydrogenase iron-sulfur subunit [Clostridiales bacterium]
MNVLILGQNGINGEIEKCLTAQGHSAAVISDIGEIKSFSGEAGEFKAKTGTGEVEAALVIVTEPDRKPMPDMGGGMPASIFDAAAMEGAWAFKAKSPVVILLDYFNESPPASTARALEEALVLASKKASTVFLFRFMRTAASGSEELYLKARNAGVTFIKYEKLAISYDEGAESFDIEVSDGVQDVNLKTQFIATDSGHGVSEKFSMLAKKLRLKADEAGYVNESRYFLAPALTGRKGVYYINPDNSESWLQETLEFIVSTAGAVAKEAGEDKNHATVDGDKCAFCYTCYRACPHGAMAPDDENRVMQNMESACEGCGACAAVCPGNAIAMSGDEFAAASLQGKSGKVKMFCCENSGEIALREILPGLGELAAKIDCETVPCGGRIGFEQMSAALRSYGKVVALVCMDDACRHFTGNKSACKQAQRLSAMLEKAGVDKKRAYCIKTSHAMPNAARDEILEVLNDNC